MENCTHDVSFDEDMKLMKIQVGGVPDDEFAEVITNKVTKLADEISDKFKVLLDSGKLEMF